MVEAIVIMLVMIVLMLGVCILYLMSIARGVEYIDGMLTTMLVTRKKFDKEGEYEQQN